MSTCSGGDPTPLFQYFDPDPTEPDQLFDADGHHIPQDPLLQSGTFIEADLDPTARTLTESQPDQNGVTETNQCEAPEPVSDEPELPANAVTTAATDGGSTPAEPKETPQVTAPPERPSWLPEGWRVDYRVRSSGASAGTVDRYYFEPASGRKFRSRKEVEYFLQTGSKRKKTANPDADANSQEKSGSKKKRSAPLNFDFNDVPENVRWVMTDAVKDQWTPFIGDQIVPKSARQEWNSAYHFSCC
ncbi:Methyl-CpG-binding domain-containing protein [Actinidia chinensis var. chinensis]|uniref:Methyl-CpG-binding domain-containing protein n=1 Tax=Actinidia chinensis var. chinensis TaxID=1590841 RepID=A0A2R6PEM5_ACTCC|nr:Methyl-CpG-binding domain-containing protein [Actinidia chinensis var. chinensis]